MRADPPSPAATPAPLQGTAPTQDSKEEPFERIDPYTRGERSAMDRAGYLSFGPFEWTQGVRTDDVRETLGGVDVLWVETPHFKIGSTLASYRLHNDTKEEKALDLELARLKARLTWFQPPHNRLDPWMRLHLYAERLEDVYAAFTSELGFGEGTPGKKGSRVSSAKGRGEEAPEGAAKYRVLLAGRTASLVRYAKRYADREPRAYDRFPLPDGSLFLGVSEEAFRSDGYLLDVSLHCVVAGSMAHNFIDGFSGSPGTCPPWFAFGLGHVFARRIDERFVPESGNANRFDDEESWKWEARVRGLVANGMAPPWVETLGWKSWEAIKTPGHLVAWSRVAWLLKRKPVELRSFLLEITRSPQSRPDGEPGRPATPAEQSAAGKAAFGRTLEELDAQWRKFAGRG